MEVFSSSSFLSSHQNATPETSFSCLPWGRREVYLLVTSNSFEPVSWVPCVPSLPTCICSQRDSVALDVCVAIETWFGKMRRLRQSGIALWMEYNSTCCSSLLLTKKDTGTSTPLSPSTDSTMKGRESPRTPFSASVWFAYTRVKSRSSSSLIFQI